MKLNIRTPWLDSFLLGYFIFVCYTVYQYLYGGWEWGGMLATYMLVTAGVIVALVKGRMYGSVDYPE